MSPTKWNGFPDQLCFFLHVVQIKLKILCVLHSLLPLVSVFLGVSVVSVLYLPLLRFLVVVFSNLLSAQIK